MTIIEGNYGVSPAHTANEAYRTSPYMIKTLEEINVAVNSAHETCLMTLNGSLHQKSPPLYHYTDLEACLGILLTGDMRFTDARYCNDPDELFSALDLLDRVHKEIIDSYRKRDPLFAFTMTFLVHYLRLTTSFDTDEIVWLKKAEAEMEAFGLDLKPFVYEKTGVYVLCLSEKNDDLRQWIPYADNGRGVAIGVMSLDAHHHLTTDESFFVVKVCYESTKKKEQYVRDFYKESFEVFKKLDIKTDRTLPMKFLNAMYQSMYVDVIACKSDNYKDEAEWRLFGLRKLDEHPKFYRVGNNILKPYIKGALNKPAVLEIIQGPKAEDVLTRNALKDVLKYYGYENAKVTKSKIAYR